MSPAPDPEAHVPAPPAVSPDVVHATAPPEVSGRAKAVVELVRLVHWHLARIAALIPDAHADRDPEAVHQIRVAARRLRCVLRVLRALGHARVADEAGVFVRRLERVTGAVRDLDVALDLVAALPVDAPAQARSLAALRQRRGPARARMVRTLDPETFATHRSSLVEAMAALPAGNARLKTRTRRTFTKLLSKLFQSLDTDLGTPDAYHEVRRQARLVRDFIDVFAGALRPRHRRWRARIQPVQARLGQLNDLDVTLALLGDTHPERAAVRKAILQRRATALSELATPLAMLAVALRS